MNAFSLLSQLNMATHSLNVIFCSVYWVIFLFHFAHMVFMQALPMHFNFMFLLERGFIYILFCIR
jgi:hypothetical protein